MYPPHVRRRRRSQRVDTLLRVGAIMGTVVILSSYGVDRLESGLFRTARSVADYSGATRASELWRTAGRPKVDRILTATYQGFRQSASGLIDHLDFLTPANRTAEKIGKAAVDSSSAARSAAPSQEPHKESPSPRTNGN